MYEICNIGKKVKQSKERKKEELNSEFYFLMTERTKVAIVLVVFRCPWNVWGFSVTVSSAVRANRRAFTVKFLSNFAARSRHP